MIDGQISFTDLGIVPRSWLYDEDTGSVLCRCPVCGGRMRLGCYDYWNPYHYCPYCGEHLSEGRFVDKMVEVYDNLDRDSMERVRKEYGKEGDTIGQNMDSTGKR